MTRCWVSRARRSPFRFSSRCWWSWKRANQRRSGSSMCVAPGWQGFLIWRRFGQIADEWLVGIQFVHDGKRRRFEIGKGHRSIGVDHDLNFNRKEGLWLLFVIRIRWWHGFIKGVTD